MKVWIIRIWIWNHPYFRKFRMRISIKIRNPSLFWAHNLLQHRQRINKTTISPNLAIRISSRDCNVRWIPDPELQNHSLILWGAVKMTKIKFPPNLMKLGKIVGIALIKMHLNFHVKILTRTLLFSWFSQELGIWTSDWTSDWLGMTDLGTNTCCLCSWPLCTLYTRS